METLSPLDPFWKLPSDTRTIRRFHPLLCPCCRPHRPPRWARTSRRMSVGPPSRGRWRHDPSRTPRCCAPAPLLCSRSPWHLGSLGGPPQAPGSTLSQTATSLASLPAPPTPAVPPRSLARGVGGQRPVPEPASRACCRVRLHSSRTFAEVCVSPPSSPAHLVSPMLPRSGLRGAPHLWPAALPPDSGKHWKS